MRTSPSHAGQSDFANVGLAKNPRNSVSSNIGLIPTNPPPVPVHFRLAPIEYRRTTAWGCERRFRAIENGIPDGAGRDGQGDEKFWDWDINGVAGEYITCRFLHFPLDQILLPILHDAHGHKAADVGDDIEVRTCSVHSYNLCVYRNDVDDRKIVLVTGVVPHFVIRGWFWVRDAKRPELWGCLPGSKRPCYILPQQFLLDIRSLQEMYSGDRVRFCKLHGEYPATVNCPGCEAGIFET